MAADASHTWFPSVASWLGNAGQTSPTWRCNGEKFGACDSSKASRERALRESGQNGRGRRALTASACEVRSFGRSLEPDQLQLFQFPYGSRDGRRIIVHAILLSPFLFVGEGQVAKG